EHAHRRARRRATLPRDPGECCLPRLHPHGHEPEGHPHRHRGGGHSGVAGDTAGRRPHRRLLLRTRAAAMVSEQAEEAPPSTAEVAYAPHMRAPEGIETPAMFLDLDVVEENIARMQRAIDRTGSVMRPHVKTHKSVQLSRMQLEAGSVVIIASSAGEAEVFSDAGVADIFIGFTVWAAGARGRRIRDLHERIRISVVDDSIDGAS